MSRFKQRKPCVFIAERISAFLFGPELSRFESRTYPSHFELPMAGRHVARRRGAAVRPSSARGREGRAGGRARRQAVYNNECYLNRLQLVKLVLQAGARREQFSCQKMLRAQVLGLEQGCGCAIRRPGGEAYAGRHSPVRRIFLWADQPIR